MANVHFTGPLIIGGTNTSTLSSVTASATVTGKDFVVAAAGSYQPDDGTVTAAAGAATLNKHAGVVTSEALVTAAAAQYTLTLTNSTIAAADMVMVSVANGTNAAGLPVLSTVAPAAGSVVIKVSNEAAAAAFNGTIKIAFVVFKS